MSNNKTSIKINQTKTDKEKYILFNEFLNNLDKYKSLGNSLNQNYQINNLLTNKINLSKYAKIDGSKNFFLDKTNSIKSKEDLNINSDNVKIIMDNLEFLTSNSKFFNTIQYQQHNIQKNNSKNKEIFSFSSSFTCSTPKNLFFINKNNNLINTNSPINNNINNFSYNINNIIFSNKKNINENENNIDISSVFENHVTNKEMNNIDKTNKLNINQNQNNTNSSLYRQDYYVKQFKVQYSIWLRNYLNQKLKQLIAETKSCRKHLKFYPLNSLKFTANPKYEDNKYFLSLKIKEILIVGIDGIKSSNQKKNKENIEIIENNIYKQNENANHDLLDFLNSTMEDSIQIFYQSEQFQKFKNSQQAKLNDLKFEQEKNFSLLKDNGFIYLIKNYKGNAKSSISFINT